MDTGSKLIKRFYKNFSKLVGNELFIVSLQQKNGHCFTLEEFDHMFIEALNNENAEMNIESGNASFEQFFEEIFKTAIHNPNPYSGRLFLPEEYIDLVDPVTGTTYTVRKEDAYPLPATKTEESEAELKGEEVDGFNARRNCRES